MPNSNWAAIVADVTVSFALLYPGTEKLDLGDGWLPTWRTPSFDILAIFCFVHRVALLTRKALVALTTAFLIRPSATAQSFVSPEPISRTRASSCFLDPELFLRI